VPRRHVERKDRGDQLPPLEVGESAEIPAPDQKTVSAGAAERTAGGSRSRTDVIALEEADRRYSSRFVARELSPGPLAPSPGIPRLLASS